MIRGAVFNVLDYGATGDGTTNDTAAIQAAITAAAVAGGAVYLPSNIYLMSTGVTIPSNVTLYGDGGTSQLKRNTAVAAFDIITIQNGAAHIGLYNFYINGVTKLDNATAANRYCGIRIWANGGARPNDIEIVGVHIDKTTSGEAQIEGNRGAILLEDCYDIRISRCKFYDNRATAIFITTVYGSTAVNTERIQIQQCYGVGEVAPFAGGFPNGFGSFISGNSHKNVLVSGCYVDGFGFSNLSLNGPQSTVENNISINSKFAGINLGHSTAGNNCDNSVVDGNITYGNQYSGVTVVASKNIVISNNTSNGDGLTSGWASIRLLWDATYTTGATTNITIIGNQCLNNQNNGISVEAGAYVQITGNLISNCTGSGMFIRAKQAAETVWSFISNNVFIDNGGTGTSGVEVNTNVAGGYGPTNSVVKDNYFYSSNISTKQRWGITSVGDTTCSIQVNNNWFSSNYTGTSVNTGATVYGYALNKFNTSLLTNANIVNA